MAKSGRSVLSHSLEAGSLSSGCWHSKDPPRHQGIHPRPPSSSWVFLGLGQCCSHLQRAQDPHAGLATRTAVILDWGPRDLIFTDYIHNNPISNWCHPSRCLRLSLQHVDFRGDRFQPIVGQGVHLAECPDSPHGGGERPWGAEGDGA